MNILILETDFQVGNLWQRHITRTGVRCDLVQNEKDAISFILDVELHVLVINMNEFSNSALSITDLATYRNPDVAIIGVTARKFFSTGTIFRLIPNMCSVFGNLVEPDDLTAVVEHYGRPQTATAKAIAN